MQIISCYSYWCPKSLPQHPAPTILTGWTQNNPTPDSTQRNANIPALLMQSSWSSHNAPCYSHPSRKPPTHPNPQKQTHRWSVVYCTVGPLKGETYLHSHLEKRKLHSSSLRNKKSRNGQNFLQLGLSDLCRNLNWLHFFFKLIFLHFVSNPGVDHFARFVCISVIMFSFSCCNLW